MPVYAWKEDSTYGFDFAIYKENNGKEHLHSIALVKQVKLGDKVEDLERWVKIANSVNKELWVVDENRDVISKLRLCKNC